MLARAFLVVLLFSSSSIAQEAARPRAQAAYHGELGSTLDVRSNEGQGNFRFDGTLLSGRDRAVTNVVLTLASDGTVRLEFDVDGLRRLEFDGQVRRPEDISLVNFTVDLAEPGHRMETSGGKATITPRFDGSGHVISMSGQLKNDRFNLGFAPTKFGLNWTGQ